MKVRMHRPSAMERATSGICTAGALLKPVHCRALKLPAKAADQTIAMFDWKPEYSVHIPEIDTQHRRLFALAGELHTAMGQGKGKAVLEHLLSQLVDYTKVHFASEEKFMRQYRYPEAVAHKAQHDQFTAQVLDFQKKFSNGDIALTVSLMVFLKNWLEGHIAGSDQKYSAHIRPTLAA
jgi:hemerythrin